MGFTSLWDKVKLPTWFLYPVAHVCDWVGWALGIKLKLNPFNVTVLTMHRWFRISNAERDLGIFFLFLFCVSAHRPLCVSRTDHWQNVKSWFFRTSVLCAVARWAHANFLANRLRTDCAP